jgi:bifunctional non-homologous end joining protein LigD
MRPCDSQSFERASEVGCRLWDRHDRVLECAGVAERLDSPGQLRCIAVHYPEQQPTFIPPMLLTPGAVPDGEAWALELKWDGCRAQLRYDGRSVTLRTRHGRECLEDFPELAEITGALGPRRVTLDGELVCLRQDGRPDFARLRRRLAGSAAQLHPAMLQVFDVLHLEGRSTRGLPHAERRALLEELALDGPAWRTPASVVVERAEDFTERVAELGLEGVVAKRRDSRYLPGRRTSAWVKRKLRREEQLAVTGIRRIRSGRVEAIHVARRLEDGSFAGAGSIELGLRRELVNVLEQRLANLAPRRRGAVTWYAAEVSVTASVHGPMDRPVRDAILLEVLPA